MKEYLVSVLCICFNQEEYIAQCLDSIIMQEVDFTYEVLVDDDASSDGTQCIVSEYADRYPMVLKPVFHKENRYSKGVSSLRDMIATRAKGKYLAICEGDDYWLDPHKLQKQVNYMESHPECTICFHPVVVKYENGDKEDEVFPVTVPLLTTEELLGHNFIQTNSVMYRKQSRYHFPSVRIMPGDWYLHIYHARGGEIGFLDEPMSVYRRHDKGLWSTASVDKEAFWVKQAISHMNFYDELQKLFIGSPQLQAIVRRVGTRTFGQIISDLPPGNAVVNEVFSEFSEYGYQLINEQQQEIDQLNVLFNARGDEVLMMSKRESEYERVIAEHKGVIADQVDAINRIVNSKSFRLGKAITAPIRALRSILSSTITAL